MKKITTVLAAVAALMMTAGASNAAPKYDGKPGYGFGKQMGYGKHNGKHFGKRGGLSPRERAVIAQSASKLQATKARAWRDGRITFAERIMIQNAERRHAALVSRLYRS